MIRHRLIVRAVLATGAIAAVYAAGWFVVSQILKSGIADWVTDRRADGWAVEHGAIAIGGFPFSWRATIDSPRLIQIGESRRYGWSGPYISLDWKPWQPQTVYYETSGQHDLARTSAAGTIDAKAKLSMTRAQGYLSFGPRGQAEQLSLLLDDAELSLPDAQTLRMNRFQSLIDAAPRADGAKPDQPHLVPSFRLDGEVFGLILPNRQSPPLGRTIGRLALRGRVLGRIEAGSLPATLSAWQQDGGTIEIDHLTLGWGPLVVRSGGTVALDSSLQPVGAMTGVISGYGETLDILATANIVKPNVAKVGKFVLGALARTPSGGGRPEIAVPLSVQNGWLSVGPIKLLQMPIVRWH